MARENTPRRGATPCVQIGELQGEPVALVPLAQGGPPVAISLQTWKERCRAGYSPFLQLKPNGHGGFYPAAKAFPPSPARPRTNRDIAREVAAIVAIRDEKAGGPEASLKGWIVRTLNGNGRDLRDCNLVRVPAKGCRNSYLAVWDARERLALAEQGLDPNEVFAERRKAHRKELTSRKSLGANSRAHMPPREGGVSPPPAPLGGLPSDLRRKGDAH